MEDQLETRVALLELCVSNIQHTLERLELKMDKGFDEIRQEIGSIRKEMKSDFRWTLTIIAGLGAIMAHGFHWF